MKKLFLIIIFCLTTSLCYAEDVVIDDQTREICNQAILNIYEDILAVKDKYKELVNFGKKALYKNSYGLYAIIYKYGKDDPLEKDKRKAPYAFGITIDGLRDVSFQSQDGLFQFGFPILGLKFSGYQRKHLLRTQLDIIPLISKHGTLIFDHQQNYLPLRLYLRPLKEIHKVREDIQFEVILKNVSKRHMIVKKLGADTLFFLFNGEVWGTSPLIIPIEKKKKKMPESKRRRVKKPGVPGVVLESGETLNMQFKGESFQFPKEIEIQVLYNMTIKGINPTAKVKTIIVDE